MLFLVVAAAAAVAAPADAAWESYACEGGPTVRVALTDTRPPERGWLDTAGGIVALERHDGEGKAVLRGGGHMVIALNWADIYYAPPAREKSAFRCRISGAGSTSIKPAPE